MFRQTPHTNLKPYTSRHMLIAITGGIGAGKSVVASILKTMGYPVYDCDSRAKLLMDSNREIINRIECEVASEAVCDGRIDRTALSKAVFGSPERLEKLNRIVHSSVKQDLLSWNKCLDLAFVETAILYTSGFDAVVDAVWEVVAPTEVRIQRVSHRNPTLTREEICKRIDAQKTESASERHANSFSIINDGQSPLLPQVEKLIEDVAITVRK